MQSGKRSQKSKSRSQTALFHFLFLLGFFTLHSSKEMWMEKTFLKNCFIVDGVELQVTLQSSSLVLERDK